jgi:predicted GNAT family acetyltransferase
MLEQGVWYGIHEGDDLIAVAGTHLVVPSEGIGAVGSVYTRGDRRGRGLGRAVTSAVTDELLRIGLRTIVLNVRRENHVAIRLYEQLGYERYCECVGGFARGCVTGRAARSRRSVE